MGERLRQNLTVLAVLLAVLFAGFAPHFHNGGAAHSPGSTHGAAHGPVLADTATVGSPAPVPLPPAGSPEPSDCPACCSAQSMRLAIAHERLLPPPAASLLCDGARDEVASPVARLVRASAPPRAPPV